MRYFRTSNATRKYKVGTYVFSFEKLSFASGAWMGVAEIDDEESGEALASYGPPVVEIDEKEYTDLKKKNGKHFPHTAQTVSPESPVAANQENVVDDLDAEIPLSKVKVKDPLESIEA